MSDLIYGPKRADHPSVGQACPVCGVAFRAGDYTTLIATRIATEAEETRDPGLATTLEAVEVHGACGRGVIAFRGPDGRWRSREPGAMIACWTFSGRDHEGQPAAHCEHALILERREFEALSGDEMADLFARRRDQALELARELMDPKRVALVTVQFLWDWGAPGGLPGPFSQKGRDGES